VSEGVSGGRLVRVSRKVRPFFRRIFSMYMYMYVDLVISSAITLINVC
jgi:hypothetical protein